MLYLKTIFLWFLLMINWSFLVADLVSFKNLKFEKMFYSKAAVFCISDGKKNQKKKLLAL